MQARRRELSFSIAEKRTSQMAGALRVKASAIGGQPPRPIADAATGPSPGKPRPHLPKPPESTPARCRSLSVAPSSEERLFRESADRCCLNKTAAYLCADRTRSRLKSK